MSEIDPSRVARFGWLMVLADQTPTNAEVHV